jgi:hypothetical protein
VSLGPSISSFIQLTLAHMLRSLLIYLLFVKHIHVFMDVGHLYLMRNEHGDVGLVSEKAVQWKT